ncbi:MAG TPA: hypothetical protein VKB69_03255 [Micromonosporaceae bacterium]|nr:hypothetical protein [Micromonosporaceae bacterium]
MRTARVLLGLAGAGLLAYGAYGLVAGPDTDPGRQSLWMLAAVVGHDFVLIPLAIGVGWLATRLVPVWARGAANAALLVTLALGVVAVPFIVKAGTFPDNPSLLPLDYGRGLLVALGATWLAAAVAALVNRHRHYDRHWRSRTRR